MTFHTKTIKTHRLPVFDMGNRRTLTTIRYGDPSSGKKAYIQAGLHADEPPGLLVMHHLIDRLDRADAARKITGEIVLVPVANPIGTSQWQGDTLLGRFDLYNGINFNRRHPDITDRVAKRIENRLGHSAEENIAVIRSALRKVINRIQPQIEGEYLKHRLLSLSFDADIVLDLHCDFQAVLYVYTGTPLWPEVADLSAQLGAEATLLSRVSGEHPFDEACSRIWWELAERYPAFPIPPACLAATVELRGQTDVNHEFGAEDAGNLFTFLKRRGFIKGRAPTIPSLKNEATPLRGLAYVKAPVPGVVVFLKKPGQLIKKGETILEIVDPLGRKGTPDRITPVKSPSNGLLLSTTLDRYARPGRTLALVAGKKPMENKGKSLLSM
jgi:predicted deacylase